MFRLNKDEYNKLVKTVTPNSPVFTNCVKAFAVGGSICALGQAFTDLYMLLGADETSAGALVSVTLIFISALLTGLNIYPKLAKFGGAGTLVPITGFANSIAAPALEAKTEGFVTGIGVKIFSISGSVILYGTLASVIAGFIIWLRQAVML